MFSFGKKLSAEELSKEWKKKLKAEMRDMDRQIRQIEREEDKVKAKIKQLAKKNEIGSVKMLAKELVTTRKHKERMLTAKAHMNSVTMQIGSSSAMNKVTGALAKSTGVLKAMNSIVSVPEVSATMREMAREMEKAGIMEEMVEDTMAMMEGDDVEELADEEVEKVVTELTAGMFLGVGMTPSSVPASAAAVGEADDTAEIEAMKARLAAL